MNTERPYLASISLLSLTILSGAVLLSANSSAETITKSASINVPGSCTMTSTGSTSHAAHIVNGIYTPNIGTTTMNVVCNDINGFSIYAVGFTGDEIGTTNSTRLVGTAASSYATIETGTATSAGDPDVSNWAMKLATDSQATYPISITTGYDAYHVVPSGYTKVATRLSSTDSGQSAEGSNLTSTYAVYTSATQAPDTYTGQVKYTLVHPNDAPAPTPPSPVTPPTSCTTPVPNLTYMQDLNSSNKATVLSSMTEDQQYYLADKRDDKTYCVAKLKDGNIWMTQNLDHDIVTDGSVTYNNTTTDLGWNGSSYSTASWSPSTATYETGDDTWEWSGTTPESSDPGNLYWNGTVGYYEDETDCVAAGGTWDSNNDVCNLIASTGSSHYHLGNYYNWTAAVAMNDSSSYITQYQDVNQSICPANWTLPKSGDNTSSGSFQYLVTQYGWNDSDYEINIWNTPIKTALAANWYGSLYGVGGYGDFWSSVVYDSDFAYGLYADDVGGVGPSYGDYRHYGDSIRCLAR